jgi:DNA-binding MarR family transcriptional regulator
LHLSTIWQIIILGTSPETARDKTEASVFCEKQKTLSLCFWSLVTVLERKKTPPVSISDIDLDVLEDTLSFYIRTVNLAVSRDLDERLEGCDVAKGTGKITTLLMVDSHPGIRPSVIAQLILKDRSAMGRLVDQMESHGLLTREISADDNRAQELYITEKGAKLAAQVRAIVTQQSRDFFDFIPEDEKRLLMDILRRAYRRIAGLS